MISKPLLKFLGEFSDDEIHIPYYHHSSVACFEMKISSVKVRRLESKYFKNVSVAVIKKLSSPVFCCQNRIFFFLIFENHQVEKEESEHDVINP